MLQSPGPLAAREGEGLQSGWVKTLQEVKFATSGIAHSFPKASHVTRTQHAHLVIICILYILLKNAYEYDMMCTSPPMVTVLQSVSTCGANADQSPHFLYWYTGFELELLALAFGHSLHPGDFNVYKDTMLSP